MLFDKNRPIEIFSNENGFTVRDRSESQHSVEYKKSKVYRSMVELIGFLEGHFTHRAEHIDSDPSGQI